MHGIQNQVEVNMIFLLQRITRAIRQILKKSDPNPAKIRAGLRIARYVICNSKNIFQLLVKVEYRGGDKFVFIYRGE